MTTLLPDLTTTPYDVTGHAGERTQPFLSSTCPEAKTRLREYST